MKKNINIKNLVIIILVVIFVILLLITIYLYNIKNYKESINNNVSDPANTEEKDDKVREKALIDALYNNFLISYILEGDIQIGDGKLVIDNENEPYYAVNDYLLEDIHSLSDINQLIDNNLLDLTAIKAAKIRESEYANQYIFSKNTLYVKKTKTPCFRTEEKLDLSSNNYRILDDGLSIVYKRVPYTFRIDKDKNIKANTLWFTCIKDIGSIKTGKEDRFEPTEDDLLKPSDFEFNE